MNIILPPRCHAEYVPQFLSESESRELFEHLFSSYDLTNREIEMADGTTFTQENGATMFLDPDLQDFGSMPEAWGQRHVWPAPLQALKDRIEATTGHQFQVCRCIHYENGERSCGFHSDLPAYGPTDFIASVSLGAEREFAFRDKEHPAEQFKLVLEEGSLLIMGEGCQEYYEHALPVDPTCREPRLNLTFRKYARM